MEDSPSRHVQSLFTGCSNQWQVHTPPQPIISQGITFKDPLHGKQRSSAELRLASCLDSPVSPRLSSGHVDSALRTPPILLLSVAEVALPSPRLPPRHLARLPQWFSSDLVSQTDLPAPQAPTSSSSTPVIPQSSLFHSSRPWNISRASYLLLLSSSRISPPILPHQYFLFSAPPMFNPFLGPSH
ncbi:hypothetical protein CRENBAI_002781 [Crenichthys baileyi]|uniref:Uncharacterized protein n=1 Tax=Crenichthys baileyi TaxID=28760 RepID=A0AAV9QN23_9TELE